MRVVMHGSYSSRRWPSFFAIKFRVSADTSDPLVSSCSMIRFDNLNRISYDDSKSRLAYFCFFADGRELVEGKSTPDIASCNSFFLSFSASELLDMI